MMINTTQDPKVGDVIAVKLVSGEEVIAELVNKEGDTYTFKRPVVLQLVPTGNGQASVSFAPFMMGLSETQHVTIEYNKMLMRPIEARKDAASQYIRSTTGLQLASSL